MYPEDLRYSKEHEWISGDGDVRAIGITHHAQVELGDIVYVELPEVGSVIEADGPLGTVESVKAVSELFCPVTGEIVEINIELKERPETINQDPYKKGWIVKLKLSKPSEVEGLMTAADYRKYLSENRD